MHAAQLENWVLSIVDRVKRGQPIEDVRVELKAKWLEATKAARQIAAHANAAAGAELLWLVGVDEVQGATGADFNELANWWPQVESQFDGIAPSYTPLNVPVDGVTVVALLFQSGRAPFVVKNPVFGTPGGGAVALEVPWREGTMVRSATRADLIRILTLSHRH